MITTAAIIADVRRAVELLAELDDAAAARVAQALDMWLRGTDFETSLGLVPGWRSYLRLSTRDRALNSLVAMHPDLNHSNLADYIIEGIERVSARVDGVRPDSADGYLADLVRAGCTLSKRQWRRLIAEVLGHQSR